VNHRRRADDHYQALVSRRRLWTVMRLTLVIVPALLAIAIGYALGPYLGPLF
jgi:hypothetical protein